MNRRQAAALALPGALAWAVAACAALEPQPERVLAVPDLDGGPRTPLAIAPGIVHVLVFTSQECPIANAYAPTLRALAASWAQQPVVLFLVHVDPDLTAAAARTHATEYELPGTIVFDPHHDLAHHFGVATTPEAVVCTAAGCVYRGRIDDQWHDLGTRSAEATQHDLANAVAAVLAGNPPVVDAAPAVGCRLPAPRPRPSSSPTTKQP
jgi:hypothetical protein